MRRTPLHAEHEAAGARLVDFAGWEMPVQYEGVRQEHLAVRGGCGIFDVSHMGEIEVSGPGAEALLQRLLTNDVASLELGGAMYACICREDGGVLDDAITYRLGPEHYLTVTNASNHAGDFMWFCEQANGFEGVRVEDAAERYAMIAVQGPTARELLGALEPSAQLPRRMTAATLELAGVEALVCGTGYTGEDGAELLVAPDRAAALWRALADAGAVPCGLASRDTLRLEACLPLYGNELSTARTPIEAGLGWCCKEATGFIGHEVVARRRERGPEERLVPFALTGPGVPRQGNPVLAAGEAAGEVTSGTMAPSLGKGAGMAYVRAELAEPGTELEIDVRGKPRPARVEKRPLVGG